MDKAQGQAAVYMLKGILSEASPEEQAKVNKAADEIRTMVSLNGDEGKVALALVVAEVAAEGGYL